RVARRIRRSCQGSERRRDDDLRAGVRFGDAREFAHERDGLVHRLVHLPVRREHRDAHGQLLGVALRWRATTPGSVRPARNSSDAPPPVEMCVILSATPAFVTAATESPPPMIVVPATPAT